MEELGGYRLVEELGSGGMGVVHLAMDGDNRPVAVKVLHPHIAHDDTARQRLAREVRTLRRIKHPRIAEVLDAELDSERPFIVTEFVDGMTLSDDVREHGPFSEDELVHFGHALLDALGAVHDAGVIHRDLKPANVMIMDGEPMVIDFGIAQVADEVRVTATGLVMGTPGYLSPEIADGKRSSEKTDWWGWAATMAFAATGRNPYGSGPLEAVLSRVAMGRANLEGAPPHFVPLLRACLDPKPERRPSSAMILDALVDIESGRTPELGRPSRSGLVAVPEAPTNVLPPARGAGGSYPGGTSAGEAPTTVAPAVEPATRVQTPVTHPAPGARPDSSQPGAGQRPLAAQQRRDGVRQGPVGYSALGIDAQQRAANPQPIDPSGPGVPAYPGQGFAGQGYGAPPNGQPGYAGPPPQGTPGYGAQPARQQRPRGALAVLALIALSTAIAPLIPAMLVVLTYIWQVIARTAGAVVRSRNVRLLRYGPGSGGGWGAAPGGFVKALFTSLFSLILPLIAAIAIAILARLDLAGIIPRGHSEEISLWAGALAAAVVLWVGPGSGSLRQGSVGIMDGIVRGNSAAGLIVALALFAIAVLALMAAWGGATVTWFPLPTNPFTWVPEATSLL